MVVPGPAVEMEPKPCGIVLYGSIQSLAASQSASPSRCRPLDLLLQFRLRPVPQRSRSGQFNVESPSILAGCSKSVIGGLFTAWLLRQVARAPNSPPNGHSASRSFPPLVCTAVTSSVVIQIIVSLSNEAMAQGVEARTLRELCSLGCVSDQFVPVRMRPWLAIITGQQRRVWQLALGQLFEQRERGRTKGDGRMAQSCHARSMVCRRASKLCAGGSHQLPGACCVPGRLSPAIHACLASRSLRRCVRSRNNVRRAEAFLYGLTFRHACDERRSTRPLVTARLRAAFSAVMVRLADPLDRPGRPLLAKAQPVASRVRF